MSQEGPYLLWKKGFIYICDLFVAENRQFLVSIPHRVVIYTSTLSFYAFFLCMLYFLLVFLYICLGFLTVKMKGGSCLSIFTVLFSCS